MLKGIALAAAVVLLNTATVSAGEANEHCSQKVTWKSIKCAYKYIDAQTYCTLAKAYENKIKHAEVDGDLNMAQYYRNQAVYQAAECKRRMELHAIEYPKN